MLDSKTQEELKQKLLEEKKRIEENISKTETGKKGTDREYETSCEWKKELMENVQTANRKFRLKDCGLIPRLILALAVRNKKKVK